MKKWYQSKQIWYAIVTGLAGVVASFQAEYPEITYIALGNSFLVVVLRMLTDKPLG